MGQVRLLSCCSVASSLPGILPLWSRVNVPMVAVLRFLSNHTSRSRSRKSESDANPSPVSGVCST